MTTRQWAGILPVLLVAGVMRGTGIAHAQKKVAAPASAITAANRREGKPTRLNGIEETVLPNGLTVLTREVHAAPVVYFSVWYKVGSVNEEVGETGMSHLMEHMMFKGTTTRGPGVISATLQNNGAEFNANTSFDRTCYFEMIAADRLELAMQIESDRMVNSVYNEAQHQKEMTVVRSEYEAGENNPATALTKALRLSAYQVHPYRWMTIGFRSDIENFTRDEMYAYYKNYYEPNNATVVIVGDFDTPKALALINKYFGPLPAKHIAQHFITPEPAQEGERRVEIRRAGTAPVTQIAYHIPGFGDPDRYVLDVLETVLGGGRTSRFFSHLVETGLAERAESYDYGLRDPDMIFLDATAQPGHSNEDLEKALLAEVDDLQKTPITADELKVALNQAEAGYIYGKDSVESQGGELGENAMRGDWRYGETYLDNLRKVTPSDVLRVARKYLVKRNRTVGYFDPLKQPAGASGDAAGPSAGSDAPSQGGGAPAQSGVWPHHAPVDYFKAPGRASADNDIQTPTTPSTSVSGMAPNETTRAVLPNGLTVIVRENHANPTVSISGAIQTAGGNSDPVAKRGLASFTASLLSRGTEHRSLHDIANALEGIGAEVSVSDHDEYAGLGAKSLSRDFNVILDVMSDELRHPAFPAEEIEKERRQSLGQIEDERDDTSALAEIALTDAIYPAGHPYHQQTLDEEAAVIKGLTRDDLAAFHAAHYGPDHMILTIVGDVRPTEAIAAVQRYFGDWSKLTDATIPVVPDIALPAPPVHPIIIQIPDKAQVDVFYGYPGQLKRTDKEFYRAVVLNTILGGGTGLASRLARRVRDQLGLVYGIYAETDAERGEGPFEVQFGANPANVDRAIGESMKQLAYLRAHGVSDTEVQHAIAYLTGSYAVTLSTNTAVSQQLLVGEMYGLGLDYIQKRNGYYRAVTTEQVNEAARKYIHPDLGTLVISGTYGGKYATGK